MIRCLYSHVLLGICFLGFSIRFFEDESEGNARAVTLQKNDTHKSPSAVDEGGPPKRGVFQIADIHGDFEKLANLLEMLKLVKRENAPMAQEDKVKSLFKKWILRTPSFTDDFVYNEETWTWIGGDAIVVFTGDYTDRGLNSPQILRALDVLQTKARNAAGDIILLRGNHEGNLMRGDFHDMTEQDAKGYLFFAGHTLFVLRHASNSSKQCKWSPTEKLKTRLNTIFKPSNYFGRMIAKMPMYTILKPPKLRDPVLFVHGGISWSMVRRSRCNFGCTGKWGASEPCFSRWVQTLNELEGPTWCRLLSSDDPVDAYGNDVDKEPPDCLKWTLTQLGARRMVVGHTTIEFDANNESWWRYGGRVIVTDRQMSRGFGLCRSARTYSGQREPDYPQPEGSKEQVSALYFGVEGTYVLKYPRENDDTPRLKDLEVFSAVEVPKSVIEQD